MTKVASIAKPLEEGWLRISRESFNFLRENGRSPELEEMENRREAPSEGTKFRVRMLFCDKITILVVISWNEDGTRFHLKKV